MFLTVQELYTHLYDETVDIISRETEAIPLHAIKAAIAEARGYLGKYNTKEIFEAKGDKRDELLLLFVKDIAVWHFVNLGNTCIDLDLREKRYDSAISWLKAVQKGNITPDLPLDANDPIEQICFGSNPKRIQHF